jgi:hypothetical protein
MGSYRRAAATCAATIADRGPREVLQIHNRLLEIGVRENKGALERRGVNLIVLAVDLGLEPSGLVGRGALRAKLPHSSIVSR